MIFQLAGTLYELLKVFCQTGLGKYQALSSWYILSVGFRFVGLGLFFFLFRSVLIFFFFLKEAFLFQFRFMGNFFFMLFSQPVMCVKGNRLVAATSPKIKCSLILWDLINYKNKSVLFSLAVRV